jgi:dihydrofolate reductase
MPGKTIWHLTMSLDGFMADQNDSIAWMSAASAPAPLGDAIVPTIGAILAGRHTYDVGITVAEPDGGRPYGGAYSGPVFVLTHEAPETSAIPEVRFLTEGLDAALATARDAAGERNVVIFGADLGQQCLDQGELDEVLVHVAPVFIGAGTPAYRSEGAAVVEFDVLESSSPGELTTLRLRPRKEGS